MSLNELHSFWLSRREHLHNQGMSDQWIFIVIFYMIHFVCYYLHGLFFVMADWYGFLEPYAIRSGKRRLPPEKQQYEAIQDASIDAFVIKPFALYGAYLLLSDYVSFDEVPTAQGMLLQWLCMKLVFSTSLFVIHGLLHTPYIYKRFHKQHHTFHETVGFTALYAHPVEAIAGSVHIVLAIVLVRPTFFSAALFFASTMIEIVDAHCGYDVPWAWLYPWSGRYPWGSGARAHDFHHSHNIGIYGGGITGLWDWLFGFDQAFVAYEAKRLSSPNNGKR